MAGASLKSSTSDWSAKYIAVGMSLGAVAAFLAFFAAWFYCISTTGFFIGVALGWIPAGICAGVVWLIVSYLWGLIALAALFAALGSHPSPPPSTPAAADAAPAAQSWQMVPAATAAPSGEPSPVLDPPPPIDAAAVRRAIAMFGPLRSSGGMAQVVTSVMACYADLQKAPSWSSWDTCAALDQTALGFGTVLAAQEGRATEPYFASDAVARRQFDAAQHIKWDISLSRDRIAALQAVMSQAITEAAREAEKQAAAAEIAEAARRAQPSFDCARARSDTLKLICATPALAAADQDMASAYRAALSSSPSPAEVRATQRQWLVRRDAVPADVTQLTSLYEARISELRQAARGDTGEGASKPRDAEGTTGHSLMSAPAQHFMACADRTVQLDCAAHGGEFR